jgi:hypothetical protein
MMASITGSSNIAISAKSFGTALTNITSGSGNIVLGNGLGALTTGSRNLAIGVDNSNASMQSLTVGTDNIAIGGQNLRNLTTDNYSIAIGFSSGNRGTNAVSVGPYSLYQNTASNNTGIGYYSGFNNTSGTNNTFIGNEAQGATGTASNAITLGNSSVDTIRAQVTSITSLSDIRDKQDIESIPVGLDFINKLNPVTFTWNMRDGGKVGIKDIGFIAQELMSAEDETTIAEFLKITYRENPEKLEVTQGRLIPILVKAIQDLSKKVDNLEMREAQWHILKPQ